MPKGEFTRTQQLCWSCRNAVPSEVTGRGCEWSRDLRPVPGWEAEAVNKGAMGLTWSIKKCPKYVAEPARRCSVDEPG